MMGQLALQHGVWVDGPYAFWLKWINNEAPCVIQQWPSPWSFFWFWTRPTRNCCDIDLAGPVMQHNVWQRERQFCLGKPCLDTLALLKCTNMINHYEPVFWHVLNRYILTCTKLTCTRHNYLTSIFWETHRFTIVVFRYQHLIIIRIHS